MTAGPRSPRPRSWERTAWFNCSRTTELTSKAPDRYGQTALSIARGLPPTVPGRDKRFYTASPHPETAELLLRLGATPLEASPSER